jgi:hypothetical protein
LDLVVMVVFVMSALSDARDQFALRRLGRPMH